MPSVTVPTAFPCRSWQGTGRDFPKEMRGWHSAGNATTAQGHRDGAGCLSVLLVRCPERLREDLNLPRKGNEAAPFTLSYHPSLPVEAGSFPWPQEGEAEAGQNPTTSSGASLAAAPRHREAHPARQRRRGNCLHFLRCCRQPCAAARGCLAPRHLPAPGAGGGGEARCRGPAIPSGSGSVLPVPPHSSMVGADWSLGTFSSRCKQEEPTSCPEPGQPHPGRGHFYLQNRRPHPFLL